MVVIANLLDGSAARMPIEYLVKYCARHGARIRNIKVEKFSRLSEADKNSLRNAQYILDNIVRTDTTVSGQTKLF